METTIKLPNISPEVTANPISKLFFCWVLPFLKFGANRTIQFRDIYDTIAEDSAAILTEELEKVACLLHHQHHHHHHHHNHHHQIPYLYDITTLLCIRHWSYEQKISRIKNRSPNLAKALFHSFGCSFMLYGFYLFLQSVILRVLHPVVLAEYIRHFDEFDSDQAIGWYFAAFIIIIALLNNFVYHHCFVGCARIGTRIKTACTSIIQKKVLSLSQYSLNRTSPSRLVKLLSEDVKKIESAMPYLHYCYITPIQFLSSTYILMHTIGLSCLTGLLFIVLVAFTQGYMSHLLKEIQIQLSLFTDSRIKYIKEILHGIRIIKMYGWEKPFEKIIDKTRANELNVISKKIFIKCFSTSTLVFTQLIAIFLTLTTHVLLGNELKTDIVFAVVLIFYNLQQYMCYFLPETIVRCKDVKAAIWRIESFLALEEKREQVKVISYSKAHRKPGSVSITNGNAKWGMQQVLQDITLKISSGSSCCILGPPGSGKSSLMELIIKELPVSSGKVETVGTVAFCSQKSWYFPSTIKRNILFSHPYNRQKYREILKICALEDDLQKLPFGDKTVMTDKLCKENKIIEKINLARTVYQEAEIYIIDDSFSSIDSQTEKFVFSQCILKYLKNHTRIFVSNKLIYAKEADVIVVLENGTINRIINTEDLTEGNFQYLNTKLSVDKNSFNSPEVSEFVEETELNINNQEHQAVENSIYKHGYFCTLGELFQLLEKRYMIGILVVLMVFTQLFTSLSDIWLVQWINEESTNSTNITNMSNFNAKNSSTIIIVYNKILDDLTYGFKNDNATVQMNNKTETATIFGIIEEDFYIFLYAIFISCSIVFSVIRSLLYHAICMNALRELHSKMFRRVLYSPIKFFETFTSGRILQRFSKDMDVIQDMSVKNYAAWQAYFAIFGTTMIVIFACPASVPLLLLITVVFYFLISCFVATIRRLHLLATNAEQPIFSFLSTSFYGVFTIRSANAEQFMTQEFNSLLDRHTSIWTLILMTSEYFCFYMDILLIVFLGITTLLVAIIRMDYYYYSGFIGLAVTHGIILTEELHLGIREGIEVLCSTLSLDKALNYTKLMAEEVEKCTLVPKNWPYCGKIVYKNVYIRDNDGRGSILKNLNIVIKPSEKIAIVSRHPEEKWTPVNSILRLIPSEGLVMLDDVDINSISLNKLRSSITVITRDPVLFSASVSYNLDPLEQVNDEMMWKALEEVGLKTNIQSLTQTIIDGGFNFSPGQRQLLCLARAILRNTKVLIIENNPSDIDVNTDNLIQKIIKEKFKNCTVITIANSLTTVMDNNKILVIDDGKEVEYAHAHELLQNSNGHLSGLVREMGPKMEEHLKKIAKDAFELKNLEIQFKFESEAI